MTSILTWIGLALSAELPSRFIVGKTGVEGIFVQVDVERLGPVWLQLDTGIDVPLYLHGRSVPEVQSGESLAFTLGSLPPTRGSVHVVPDLGGAVDRRTDKVGSIGAPAFDNLWLVIDMPGRRVEVFDQPEPAHEADTCWVKTQSLDARSWVYVEDLGRLLFDTGSAPHGVWTNARAFELLTGVSIAEAPVAIEGFAFGKPMRFVGLPSAAEVRLGLPLQRPLVTYTTDRRAPKRAGILGLQPFAYRTVILDRTAGRLGVVGACAPVGTDSPRPTPLP